MFATVSSPEKAELCRSLGADLVIDHTQEDVVEAVLGATDDVGADVICDLAGGSFVSKSWQCVAREGRYLAVGFTDDDENGMTGRPLRMASIGNFSVVGVLGAWVDDLDPGMRRFGFNPFTRADGDEVHQALVDLIAAGKIRPTSAGSWRWTRPAQHSTTTNSGARSGAPSSGSAEPHRRWGRSPAEAPPTRPGAHRVDIDRTVRRVDRRDHDR